jgi:hypothetical protein
VHSGHRESRPTPLPLVAHAQRDDEHVAMLKLDQLVPKFIHTGRAVLKVDARRPRDARGVEAR